MPVTYYVWNQTALGTANTDPVFAGQNKGIYASNYVQVSSTSLPYYNVVLFQTDKGQVDENGNRVPDIGSGISIGGGYILTADHLFRSFGASLAGNTSWAWRGYVAPSDVNAAPDPATAAAQISISYTTTDAATGEPSDPTQTVWEIEPYSNGTFTTSDLAVVKAPVGYTPQSDVADYGLVAINRYDRNRWSSASSIGYAGLDLSATYAAGSSPAPVTMYELPFSGINVSGHAWSANAIGAAGNSGGPLVLQDKNGHYYVAGVLTYANATGVNGATGNVSAASTTGGRLLTNEEIFAITTQIKKASGQQNGWWDSQPENIYYASDDSPDSFATDDRTDIVYGGLSASTVVGSLGDDRFIGDPSAIMKVRYDEEAGDQQDVKDNLDEIQKIALTLEVGYEEDRSAAEWMADAFQRRYNLRNLARTLFIGDEDRDRRHED
jgi:hypothetical protein